MKKQLSSLITFLLILNGLDLGSEGIPGDYVLQAELLYFKPAMDQSSYAISSSDNHVGSEYFPSGKHHLNRSNYTPGVRLEGLYALCSEMTAFDLRGTYFSAGHSNKITGDFLYDTIGYPGGGAQAPEDIFYKGTAHIKDHYQYGAIDATLNRLSLNSFFDDLFFLVGLHYATIHHKTRFTSKDTPPKENQQHSLFNVLRSNSHFWGIGPELGVDYSYKLTPIDCPYGILSLGINARGALLYSDTEASFHYTSLRTAESEGVNLKNDSLSRVTPAVDAKLEGTYRFTCSSWDIMLSLGYEWLWYGDSIDSIQGMEVAFPGDSLDIFSNFSAQGPFFRLGIAF
jgi:hypothetical protein